MHFRIQHRTLYRYDVPVELGPHTLRLTPRGGFVTPQLVIDPQPVAQWSTLDSHGNHLTCLTFAGSSQHLHIESRLELQQSAATSHLDARALAPLPQSFAATGPPLAAEVFQLASGIAERVGGRRVEFLDTLCQELHQRIEGIVRTSGEPQLAARTLADGRGACRDVSILFLACCRAVGLEGRFVSGYHAVPETLSHQADLHAWVEFDFDNRGTWGWDPSVGQRVGPGHVALCAAPTHHGTQPIEGNYTFQGPLLNSTLDFTLEIDTRS